MIFVYANMPPESVVWFIMVWKFAASIRTIAAPISSASIVPTVPAMGKNVEPGITNAPQPIMQPKESAHTASGEWITAVVSEFRIKAL